MPETESLLSFDEIRPYLDQEVPQVLKRLSRKPSFFVLMNYLFPEQTGEEIVARFSTITSVEQFQSEYIRHAIWRVVQESTSGVTIEGLEALNENTCYVFLSNHRDIILDSAILNVLLKEQGRPTTKIAIGDNLLVSGLVTDLMKLNKSFIVHREVARKDMLAYSKRLSNYIRTQITNREDSVWIAQRNGRTKDGNDQTHTGLLKMLSLSGPEDVKARFRELNIVPMSISYEYDPCDGLKAEELTHLYQGASYQKDDKVGMVKGIRGQKGRVHICLGSPVNDWLDDMPECRNLNAWLREFADSLDRILHQSYRLWPSNYIAFDLLEPGTRFVEKYNDQNVADFLHHMDVSLADMKGAPESLKCQFLEIYANPVRNKVAGR